METTETLLSPRQVAHAVGITRSAVQKAIQRNGLHPAVAGHTQNGGYRYRLEDLRLVFGDRLREERLPTTDEPRRRGSCLSCGRRSWQENYDATHGLCLDCWCRELNKWLIDRSMRLEEAEKAAVESLKAKGVI